MNKISIQILARKTQCFVFQGMSMQNLLSGASANCFIYLNSI